MKLYCSQQITNRRKRIRVWGAVSCISAAVGLIGCIVCCCLCTTATAAKMERTALLISNTAGWLVIYALTAQMIPNRQAMQHEANVLSAQWDSFCGHISLEKETLYIPKSIAIRKVVVDTGTEVYRLSVRADKASLLAPWDGKQLSVQAAYGYIAAFEEIGTAHE